MSGNGEITAGPPPNGRRVVECEYCGEQFSAVRADARFCSSVCRSAMWAHGPKRSQPFDQDQWYARIMRLAEENRRRLGLGDS